MEDELIGCWENDAGDSSGLHAIWGFGIEFLDNGKGVEYDWGIENKGEVRKTEFFWKREGEKSILIRDEETENWTKIIYEISEYSTSYFEIISKEDNELYFIREPLYKYRH